MEVDNRTIVNEEEVYAIPSSSMAASITYSELVSASPSKLALCGPLFKTEWQSFPEFQSWLRPIPDDKTKAWCRACEKMFKADLKSLRVHGVGKSHIRMVQSKFSDEVPVSTPTIAYNVITDRKGTYGIGIISRPDNSIPISGNTLYVNPTNPNTNILTCDPKQDKDNYVIVSIPKSENNQTDMITDTSIHQTAVELQQLDHIELVEQSQPQQQQLAVNIKRESQHNNQSRTSEHSSSSQIISTQNVLKETKQGDQIRAEDLIEMEDVEDVYDFDNGVDKPSNVTRVVVNEPNVLPRSGTNAKSKLKQFHRTRAFVSKPAPYWKSSAIVNGHITELKLTDYRGRYLVLFFYAQDFSQTCPGEIIALSDRIADFRAVNAEIVACSVDSPLTHQAWARISRADGGIAYPKIPLLSDRTHSISKSYGCYLYNVGHALPATYIIDTCGIVRHITINDLTLGRCVNELLRLVQAFQHIDESGLCCPMDWKPGRPDIAS